MILTMLGNIRQSKHEVWVFVVVVAYYYCFPHKSEHFCADIDGMISEIHGEMSAQCSFTNKIEIPSSTPRH